MVGAKEKMKDYLLRFDLSRSFSAKSCENQKKGKMVSD